MDLNKTLEQLERDIWDDTDSDISNLVQTCHALRKKPLKDFEIEDLRIMIGQRISLELLIPVALVELTKNLNAEGDMYPGDLLSSVLTSDKDYWQKNKDMWDKVLALINSKASEIFDYQDFSKKINAFKQISFR